MLCLILFALAVQQVAVSFIVRNDDDRRSLAGTYTNREDSVTDRYVFSVSKGFMSETTPPLPTTKRIPEMAPICSENMSDFRGREAVDFTYHEWRFLEEKFNDAQPGGHWKPKGCKAKFRVAFIIPFQDRDSHLKIFMSNIVPKLQRQQLEYTIFLVEQAPGQHFNRGMMRNIGFVEASKNDSYDCYVFNDVDTIIENDKNMFKCDAQSVRHLAAMVDIFNYTLLYKQLIGGILSVTYRQFISANGYSNSIYLWGGEDDDLYDRFRKHGYRVSRPSKDVGHITTLLHERKNQTALSKETSKILLKKVKNQDANDGLTTLGDKYTLVLREERKLYTWLYVRVHEDKVLQALKNLPRNKHASGIVHSKHHQSYNHRDFPRMTPPGIRYSTTAVAL
ncbi:beta-1,4-galactosyltransferase 6-like [Argopecten irradians]|uniref:beta-1,4-galactosyltransferase 6-like n=1 Tax=Argopecten irradians TaxID=31199 RepID=UPI00371AFF89